MGNSGSFKKGHVPWNKGKTGYISANKTSFKKGHLPLNTREMNSERLSKNGYIEIKVGINKWISKHRYIWEQYQKKEVPKGKVVIFLDGNNRNFEIENLKLISRGALLILNKRYKHITKDRELMNSCVDLSELIISLKKKERNKA
ncbi:HNH endonuclease signature motif containing protein [uncultured Gemella sp.]|uniref:HNH endonuclease signature motif containing protein n=1 Tax=uncultured Gemella sp. TaxID=254352 RepID=UPI0025E63993|nr:HNH endonuclease signature motif containing protein [uncultured Gemella sp.]